MRRALIGAIVAIFALLPCLGFGYPAGARSSKGHHAQCANAARSKAKRAKRRAKCKKPRKSAQRRTRVAQKVGRSAPATKPSAASTTPVGMPTTAGPAPAAPSGTAPTTTGPAPAAPSGTAPTTTVRPPSSPTPTTPTRTPAEERELSEAKAEHTSAAEALAQELLGELLLPQGAVQVASEPGLGTPAPSPVSPELVDKGGYWQVPGEPEVVAAWIEAHVPAGARLSGYGDSTGLGVMRWFAGFRFPVNEPDVISSEELAFEAIAAEGGGTALRADGEVIWTLPRAASEHIPDGIAAISVRAAASQPAPVSVSQTITEAASVQEVIALIEGLHPPGGGFGYAPPTFRGRWRWNSNFSRPARQNRRQSSSPRRGAAVRSRCGSTGSSRGTSTAPRRLRYTSKTSSERSCSAAKENDQAKPDRAGFQPCDDSRPARARRALQQRGIAWRVRCGYDALRWPSTCECRSPQGTTGSENDSNAPPSGAFSAWTWPP